MPAGITAILEYLAQMARAATTVSTGVSCQAHSRVYERPARIGWL